jgi:alpha-L-fucosidase
MRTSTLGRVSRLLLPLPLLVAGACQATDEGPARPEHKPKEERIAWWREARFGLFIHWGLYSIPAGQWGERTNHAEWIRTTAEIPLEEYEQLQPRFNPVGFDADAWVLAAKNAGMRYVVITSKHHDGFCLWDSDQTDWDVAGTPFERDVLAELAAACERHGLRMCWYHSIMDWHHPDYLPRRGWEQADRPADGADFARYVEYLRAQVTELLTRYGPIGVMWFDGEWESTWNHELGQALYDLCLELQPDVLVNNRVDVGRGGMGGMTEDDRFAGDFGTPEQEIPATGLPGVDWETCMTMNANWGYNRADTSWKSTEELVRTLVDIASKGGNFLLNVGPTAQGTFPPEALERLEGMGRWMERFGESIYGTQASPFESLPWGRATMRTSEGTTTLYLQVFDWPLEGQLRVPGLGNRPLRAWIVGDEETPLEVTDTDTDVVIAVPARAPDAICTAVALEIEGTPVVYEAPRIEAASTRIVNYVEARLVSRSPDLELRYTLDRSDPGPRSELYKGPIRVDRTGELRARAFHRGKAVSPVVSMLFERVPPRLATRVADPLPGLLRTSWTGDWNALPDLDTLEPEGRSVAAGIELGDAAGRERCALRFEGFLEVPADEVYTLALESDDGSRLWIGDELVVDNDGLHGAEVVRGTIGLARGHHPIRVEWFNKGGGGTLGLRWAQLDGELAPVPAAALSHAAE